MNAPTRLIAIDWSGSARPSAQRKHIWTADVCSTYVRLFDQMTREEVCSWLIEQNFSGKVPTIVGIDFAFSLPTSYRGYKCYSTVGELWRMSAAAGEDWLRRCPLPFWGKPGRKRPVKHEAEGFRKTDCSICVNGISPKSPFQIGGAGAVGTGSIRGFPILSRLREMNFSIWPFDQPRFPMVVEIYPRLLTGQVRKSQETERIKYLRGPAFAKLPEAVRMSAESSEDAFDALVSAIMMQRHASSFARLVQTSDPIEALEGRIWIPGGKDGN